MQYHLAIDIGASSGRHILGSMENETLCLEEVYRFDNRFHKQDKHLVWDANALFDEICNGLCRCAALGKVPVSLGVDTWGVDYVLLDSNMRELWPSFAYRDARGGESQAAAHAVMPYETLYATTGIARQPYNTIYQLWHDKQAGRLNNAAHLLMLPDYFHWRLTGEIANEYTIASTTGLVDATTQDWAWEIIDILGYPRHIFGKLHKPGQAAGQLQKSIQEQVGFRCAVTLPGGHDTANAFAACPCQSKDALYISSGTWSLMGAELDAPQLTSAAREAGFTNEGGANGKIRFLRNIMGLWMLQQIKREQQIGSFAEVIALGRSSNYTGALNVQNPVFLAPESMTEAVRVTLSASVLPLPDVISAVYHGLARCYAQTAREIEQITGQRYSKIHIIGGGSGDSYLNELTAQYSGKTVLAGPKEATAIGNLLAQMGQGRAIVRDSFALTEFQAR